MPDASRPVVARTGAALDRVMPAPNRREIDSVDLALPLAEAWEIVRHVDLAPSRLARALFSIRSLPGRLRHRPQEPRRARIDDLVSTEARPGFGVLVDEPLHAVVVGAIGKVWQAEIPFVHVPDAAAFAAFREAGYVRVAWALEVTPLSDDSTRVDLEVRVDATDDDSWRRFRRYFRVIGPASRFMRRRLLAGLARRHGLERADRHLVQTAPLRHPAARAEGRQPNGDWRDVLDGAGGAAIIAAALLTPFLRPGRRTWGLDVESASRALPGDDLVATPRWGWTHGIEIDAPADVVWPWISQIGADRAGFSSYQWLENIPGCDIRNAETVHPEWAVKEGDGLRLHPDVPALPVVLVEPGRCFVAHLGPEPGTDLEHDHWADVSWLFLVEPLGPHRCRVVSRYRCATSDDLATRLQFGPTFIESVGFAMDRRMLRGIKERAERERARSGASGSPAPA
jgi:hypothetical protein